ncbi:MAG: thrombospondin type 3 repeat-containing protein [Planctomycetes bacterium]|nr:thrombospondin type 3 repeat-containing protein [Planctomycetota bacterium]
MPRKYLLLSLFVGLSFFLAGLAIFRSAFFQPPDTDAGGFGISPPSLIASLAPGESYERRINMLRSEADRQETARVRIDPSALAGWVRIEPAKEIAFWPGDYRAPFTVAVQVPPDAAPGVYYGAIRLTLNTIEQLGGVGIELGARLDVRIKVKGEIDTLPAAAAVQPPSIIAESEFYHRLKGRLIMRAEAAGETYYVDPVRPALHYLRGPADAYRLIRMQGQGITAQDLSAIPCSVYSPSSPDSDDDGLSDELEAAISTNRQAGDTDQDGFDDKFEIANGYDPLKRDTALTYNRDLAERLKGRILLMADGRGEAWYVHPAEGQRYFLGQSDYAWVVFNHVAVGVSENDFSSLTGN